MTISDTSHGRLNVVLSNLLTGVFGMLITITCFSAADAQSQQAPTLRIVSEDGNRLPSEVVITGDDIRNLPAGENRLIFEGGNTSAPSGASGGVWKTTNGGKSWNLTKTGTGHLILPNTYRGQTFVNDAANNSAGLNKVGLGTLVLSGTTNVIYEFRNVRTAEFSRIFLPDGENRTTDIKTYLSQHRPPQAMKGWPFQNVLIGSAKGIAEIKGWKPGTITSAPRPDKAQCNKDLFCICSVGPDCDVLVALCRGDMICDGDICWCQVK